MPVLQEIRNGIAHEGNGLLIRSPIPDARARCIYRSPFAPQIEFWLVDVCNFAFLILDFIDPRAIAALVQSRYFDDPDLLPAARALSNA